MTHYLNHAAAAFAALFLTVITFDAVVSMPDAHPPLVSTPALA